VANRSPDHQTAGASAYSISRKHRRQCSTITRRVPISRPFTVTYRK
jgi:hypothetical protein